MFGRKPISGSCGGLKALGESGKDVSKYPNPAKCK